MPILYLNFKHIHCGGCITSIENCLFRLGIDHFTYDLTDAMAKIMFDKQRVTLEEIMDCIKHLGYEPHIADLLEYDDDEV
jgi:copper chaperone CopZ